MLQNEIYQEDIFNKLSGLHHGQLHFFHDSATNLKAIVAIDSISRGPALGGCRFLEYNSTADAITDVIRLAKGMTLKAAIANLDFGGGKTVIIQPKNLKNRRMLFNKFGTFVNSLNGQYITAMDSGTTLQDMQAISQTTSHVINLKPHHKFTTADPSSYTALGLFYGMKAAAKHKFNKDSLKDLHIAISGMGNVGQHLGALLIKAGANLTITDLDFNSIKTFLNKYPAKTCSPEEFYALPCDIISPCALGGCLNEETISQLNTKIIAGAANNQLLHKQHAKDLHNLGILYAPDFVINSGGLMHATSLYLEHNEQTAINKIESIEQIMHSIFTRAQQTNKSPDKIAIELAIEQLPIDQNLAFKHYTK